MIKHALNHKITIILVALILVLFYQCLSPSKSGYFKTNTSGSEIKHSDSSLPVLERIVNFEEPLHPLATPLANSRAVISTELFVEKISKLLFELDASQDQNNESISILNLFLSDPEISRENKASVIRQLLLLSYERPVAALAILQASTPYKFNELKDDILLVLVTSTDASVRMAALELLRYAHSNSVAFGEMQTRPSEETTRQIQDYLRYLDYDSLDTNGSNYWERHKIQQQFAPVETINGQIKLNVEQISSTNLPFSEAVILDLYNTLLSRPYDQIEILKALSNEFGEMPLFTQNKVIEMLLPLYNNNYQPISDEAKVIINQFLPPGL